MNALPSTRLGQKHLLTMKKLTHLSKTPKSTVLYYLSLGLLPRPQKTSRNMAYYDPQCVPRLKLIRFLQEHHRLSLGEIRRSLKNKKNDDEISTQLELNQAVFGPALDAARLTRKKYCQATGLQNSQVESLLALKLLAPVLPGQFDQQDVKIGQIYARATSMGIDFKDLEFYVQLGSRIVDQEFALRQKANRTLNEAQDAVQTLSMVQNARLCREYVIDRIFQLRIAAMKSIKGGGKDSAPSARQISDIPFSAKRSVTTHD